MLPALLVLACSRAPAPPATGPAPDADAEAAVPPLGFTLAFSGNLDGELEPCG